MSQNAIPPQGGVGLAEPETADLAVEGTPSGNRKVLLILVAALVAVAAVAAWFLVFSGGGSEEEQLAMPVKKPAVAAPADPAAAPAPDAAAVPAAPPAFDSATGRDPFKPLVKTAEQAAAEAQAAADAKAAASGSTTVDANGNPVTTGMTLGVVQVEDTGAWVTATVDGQTYANLPAGAPFGQYFQVYSIFAPGCAGFLYGDENVVVCEGKSVTLTK